MELRVVSLIDSLKGQRYVEQVNSEAQEVYLDHIYNVFSAMDDYINQTANGKLSWKSIISYSLDSREALENW